MQNIFLARNQDFGALHTFAIYVAPADNTILKVSYPLEIKESLFAQCMKFGCRRQSVPTKNSTFQVMAMSDVAEACEG